MALLIETWRFNAEWDLGIDERGYDSWDSAYDAVKEACIDNSMIDDDQDPDDWMEKTMNDCLITFHSDWITFNELTVFIISSFDCDFNQNDKVFWTEEAAINYLKQFEYEGGTTTEQLLESGLVSITEVPIIG